MGDQCREFCNATEDALTAYSRSLVDREMMEVRIEWGFYFVLKDLRVSISQLRQTLSWWRREIELLPDDEAFARLAELVADYDYLQPPGPGEALSTEAMPTLRHIGAELARAVQARHAPVGDDFNPPPPWTPPVP